MSEARLLIEIGSGEEILSVWWDVVCGKGMHSNNFEFFFADVGKADLYLVAFRLMEKIDLSDSQVSAWIVGYRVNVSFAVIKNCLLVLCVTCPLDVLESVYVDVLLNGEQFHYVVSFFSEGR